MKNLLRLFPWEFRHVRRSGSAWLVCSALLIASALALWAGRQRLDAHKREVAALPRHYAAQMERIAHEFTPQGEAGYVSYYTFYPTHHPLSPLGALSFGVRDIVPGVVWVRLLGIEGQLYESDLGNPLLQALGSFDFAFVWCALAPLALLVLSHDVLTRDRDAGRLRLAAVQGGSLLLLLLVRLAVRAALITATSTIAFLAASAWLGFAWDGSAFAWLGAVWAHLACWTGIAAVIAVLARTVGGSLAVALTTWTAAVVLVPALMNLALVTFFPVKDGLELTVRQRQESHAAWDKPRAETMDKFFAHNPDWSGTPPVTGRFAWRWYYAMQQVGDESVAVESQRYRSNLRARQTAITRLAWLAPAAYAQLVLSARSGTDLEAHLDYLDRVRGFHAELRRRFYPLFFAEATITPADYAAFPRFDPEVVRLASGPPLWPLLALGLCGVLVATFHLNRKRES